MMAMPGNVHDRTSASSGSLRWYSFQVGKAGVFFSETGMTDSPAFTYSRAVSVRVLVGRIVAGGFACTEETSSTATRSSFAIATSLVCFVVVVCDVVIICSIGLVYHRLQILECVAVL